MAFSFVDIHSHIHFEQYDADRAEVLKRLADAGGATIAIGTNRETCDQVLEVSIEHENVFACVGVYPVDIHEREDDVLYIEKLLADDAQQGDANVPGRIVAVGECGLDYAGNPSDEHKQHQKRLFEAQIDMAVRYGKPVMIHCRDAYEDTLAIVEAKRAEYGERFHAHMHFFAGPLDILERLMAAGGTVSFTGVITFARQYDEVVKAVPVDWLMPETDSPYVTPAPHRGMRNEPLFVREVIAKLAEIRGVDEADLALAMRANVERVFGV